MRTTIAVAVRTAMPSTLRISSSRSARSGCWRIAATSSLSRCRKSPRNRRIFVPELPQTGIAAGLAVVLDPPHGGGDLVDLGLRLAQVCQAPIRWRMDRLDRRRAVRDQSGIDLVVLRQLQVKPPIGAHLRGLEHDDHQAATPQPPDDRLLIAPTGFDADPFDTVPPQPSQQPLVTLGRIGHLQIVRSSVQRHIELMLASIDASANYATVTHLLRSSLECEPDAHSTMRASMKMPIAILLRRSAL